MIFTAFKPEHLAQFTAQPLQAEAVKWMGDEIAEAAAHYFSFTGVSNGEIVGCAGIAPDSEGRLTAWAVFGEALEANYRSVFRAVKAGLEAHSGQAIRAHIAPEHAKAARFAEALQFRFSGALEGHPSGAMVRVYVRGG